ncbi:MULTISPECIES: alpha/beta hydrolase [Paracoccus]|uniref:Alpha/beta hydrolase n=1 Tax=Paracoccus aerius TaxID=1915382 RepID=A0ABS1SBK7_9RHOB|nr:MULTISPECIES: alpha/beta hydrolase [Paracoccus]MBL3675082.1 alpha/beta hydrolase [Paracoccus aerius]QIR84359.1 alpha/beta hydrolase [Paracoccus sp. AK26]GHG30846.1 hypothetical protein GCM10017322_32150 [Paracoccus aerius]
MQDLYRNRDFIPDFDAIIEETAARSRALAARTRMQPDIAYGAGPRERMDILLPQDPQPGAPLHLFIHGGYWRSGSKEVHHLVAGPVLAAGGIAAIVTYDLMPGMRLDAIVGQVRAAARHLVGMAPALGADPARLTVSGHSAGAHLACYLAGCGTGEEDCPPLPPLRGLLLVSGIYDLSGIPDSFLKDEAKMTPQEALAWSPLTSRHDPGPRRIVTCGEKETRPFHQQASAMAALLQAKGAAVDLRTERGLNHLDIVLSLGDPASPLGRLLSGMVATS